MEEDKEAPVNISVTEIAKAQSLESDVSMADVAPQTAREDDEEFSDLKTESIEICELQNQAADDDYMISFRAEDRSNWLDQSDQKQLIVEQQIIDQPFQRSKDGN